MTRLASSAPAPSPTRARSVEFALRFKFLILALIALPAMAIATTFGVLYASKPPPAPANVKPGSPLAKRLAERVLLVIVDGLRYDVAMDPQRMPLFSQAMREHVSGEIWAGTVSMTSSAVMAIGTGQHGRLEQVIRNLHSEKPAQNAWLQSAHAQGLRLVTVGDPAWPQMYSDWLTQYRTDPEGVAIDVDFNPRTFADVREALAEKPDFLVAHFVTPDHQGHAYRVTSERYARHIRDFDTKLRALLSEFDESWTVIVTSDHGAADSGTHGTDAVLQRRSPIYAYGRGIARAASPPAVFDQLDLSVTLPLLLGVAPPAHGTGRALVEWIDMPPEQRATVACDHAARVLDYAEQVATDLGLARQAVSDCRSGASPGERITAANRAIRQADRAVSSATGLRATGTHLWVLAILGLGGLCILLLLPRMHFGLALSVTLLLTATVWLVARVEKLPSNWPNVVRATLFVLGNSLPLALVIRPSSVALALRRFYPYTTLFPVALALSYPANTRPEAVVVACTVGFVYAWFGTRLWSPAPNSGPSRNSSRLWLSVAMLGLVPVMLHENGVYSSLVHQELTRQILVSLLAGAFAFWLAPELKVSPWVVGLTVLVAALPTWLRPWLGPTLGRGTCLLAGLGFCAALYAGRSAWVVVLAIDGLLLISRDFETIPLIAAVSAAWVVGSHLKAKAQSGLDRADLVLVVAFGFSLSFVLRMGMQDGLEFAGMDWGAGGFNDPGVSSWFVGAVLVGKYALGAWLVGYALCRELPRTFSLDLLVGISLCFVLRSLALAGMFFFAGNSYWTALRVIGDLPTAMAMSLGCVGILLLRAFTGEPAAAPPSAQRAPI